MPEENDAIAFRESGCFGKLNNQSTPAVNVADTNDAQKDNS